MSKKVSKLRTGWYHGEVAFTHEPNRTVVRLEVNQDDLSNEVLDQLFALHQSSLLCIHTSSKGACQ